jgi:hypothetical protein
VERKAKRFDLGDLDARYLRNKPMEDKVKPRWDNRQGEKYREES